jgi:hypothetical protein
LRSNYANYQAGVGFTELYEGSGGCESGGAGVLTKNGRGKYVILAIEDYEKDTMTIFEDEIITEVRKHRTELLEEYGDRRLPQAS